MSFIKRKIDLTFQLGTGTFGESGANTVTCSGLRVHAHITGCFGPGNAAAQVNVYGLSPSLLNQLSALNQGSMAVRKNTLIIAAGDDVSGMATVFQGQIMLSQIMLNTAPDTTLSIMAQTGAFAAVQRVAPTSYPGTADAAVIMQTLAYEAGLGFENNGVSVILPTPYFPGSPLEKIRRCATAAGIEYLIDAAKNVLAIFPVGGSRNGLVPVISPATGMIGYPSYASGNYGGLSITTLFNPLLRPGGVVAVESSLQVANGQWGVYDIEHELSSEDPSGPWFTRFTGSILNGS